MIQVFKKRLLITLITAMTLVLAACGQPPEEKLTNGFDTLLNAKQLESNSTISMNLEFEGLSPEEEQEMQMFLDALKNAEINMHAVKDNEAEKAEATISLHAEMAPLSFDIELPYHIDLKNQVMYLNADSLIENFALMMPELAMFSDQIQGKLIKMDLNDPELASDFDNLPEETMDKINEVFMASIENLGEDDIKEEEDTLTISFGNEEIKDIAKEVLTLINNEMEESDQISEEELNEQLEIIFETITVNDLTIESTFDGDTIQSQKINIDVTLEEAGETMKFNFVIDTTYDKINEEVTFTIDPESAESISIEELLFFDEQLGY